MTKRKVGVLISGNGSNLQALIEACADADYPAEIVLVISNKDNVHGLVRASQAGISTQVISHKVFPTREAFDAQLDASLRNHHVEIVCLAGFMRLLTAEFVNRWQGRMLNIHPSLLPAFKGARAIEAALAAGVAITGCSVHYVTPEMDGGPVILQAEVPLIAGDTLESLSARIHRQEHAIYPQALRKAIDSLGIRIFS